MIKSRQVDAQANGFRRVLVAVLVPCPCCTEPWRERHADIFHQRCANDGGNDFDSLVMAIDSSLAEASSLR
jgi:hypothetical protein